MDREGMLRRLHDNRRLAHKVLFPHRHLDADPPFHGEMIDALHGSAPEVLLMAFRGAAKSTRAEEAVILRGCFQEFHNALIVGASERRAVERLLAVKRELELNEAIAWLFGEMSGGVWQETKIELRNGVVIQAAGRDQNLRGVKHLDWRPDFVLIDDVEDPEAVQSPDGREKTMDWLLAELVPACDPRRVIRMLATPMDADSVPMRLKRRGEWPVLEYPIEYLDERGERVPSWPERYPMEWIDRTRKTYFDQGKGVLWEREYMLSPIAESARIFRQEMIRVEPRERRWEACFAAIDPARTVKATSATTGWAVWSWLKNRLVVWASGAELLLPDQIVGKVFAIAEQYHPTWIGVEEDGLNEWLLQPLRQEQLRRGVAVPVRALRAPRGKIDFIRGLQPFFAAREVTFADAMPDLEAQLLSFPTGRIDAPNALAYALPLRPGQPIYDGFEEESIVDGLDAVASRPLYLAMNATGAAVTGVLIQFGEGVLTIIADWTREGDAGSVAAQIAGEASLLGGKFKAILPPWHWERYGNVGLVQALQAIPVDVARGAGCDRGREWLRGCVGRHTRGVPACQVSADARNTLNALFGGYCRAVDKRGVVGEQAEEGIYRTLMEGLESVCALMAGSTLELEGDRNYAFTPSGHRYLSARPMRR